ncbi:MAG: FAD-dependent oxidoreductase [Acidiferrobacterales bacterium]|jgi:NADPH-dependent glutamate synthase beta subunit-like oxidoreductase/NAD(P)H-flavin reductase|nr:FAD-dependent oxidoreductase [Acidiferrobacterales bacterium]
MAKLKLGLPGFTYEDLFEIEGLTRVDQAFLEKLAAEDATAHKNLLAYRQGKKEFTGQETSELLITSGRVLEDFIGEFFGIGKALQKLRQETVADDPVFEFKKLFVLRRARRRLLKNDVEESFAYLDDWLTQTLRQAGLGNVDRELAIARFGQRLMEDAKTFEQEIERLTRWCIRAMTTPEGKQAVSGWVSFKLPQPVDHNALVPTEPVNDARLHRVALPRAMRRRRDGFKLTDRRMSQRQVQAEVDYCIYCHDHDGDFCSKGFPVKKGEPDKGIKINPLGVELVGCPLDEKISEMHCLKKEGRSLGALAIIMVDNPMCPATGHRICNDCMKACVYQKQDPVNIPEIETRALTDVLALPWGVEIYDLLTRWNPLRKTQYLPKPYNGLKVLITGMGPAGFTLAHHLTMEGFAVVGVDGLKIEPLSRELIDQPIEDYKKIEEELDTRVLAGFGGVAEYGITVRWDKNFLRLLYLNMMRRPHFQVFGGVRFGGTLTIEEAWELGFDHVAIAVGAGLPQALPIPGSLAPGMRMAADFLMALQLTGAAKKSSLANLQMRLPAVVIGGGLTGIDAATEAQAYYITQVEKLLERYETLTATLGREEVRERLDVASLEILEEFVEHGRAVRYERKRAADAGEAPNFQMLVQRWGGVTVAYRRRMQDSPAYKRNHEEIIKAMEEGIYYAEGMYPKAAKLDKHGQVKSLLCERMAPDGDGNMQFKGDLVELPAKTVLVATGAKPNIAYYFEHRGTFNLEGQNYQTNVFQNGKLERVAVAKNCKDPSFGAFTSYDRDDKRVSFIGDTHPVFNGNVVKAVASGMRIYPKIVETFGKRADAKGKEDEYLKFNASMRFLLQPKVLEVIRHTPHVVELLLHAPQAAKRYQPGQIYRLQNFEALAAEVDGTRLQTETIALTGSQVDKNKGTVSLIVRERGASTRLCSTLKAGDPVVLMGPGGNATQIPIGKTILVIGDWLAAAAMRALGPAYKASNNRVLFIVTFPHGKEIFCQDELEQLADAIVWVTHEGHPIVTRRQQDVSFTGKLEDVLVRYATGKLTNGAPPIPLDEVDHIHITADNRLLRVVQDLRRGALKEYFVKDPVATGSVYSSMQCMLKGVCSQCLQWQLDPETGQRTKAVFACSWQDEPIDLVDLTALDERLSQNRLQERLANLWLDHLFETKNVDRV